MSAWRRERSSPRCYGGGGRGRGGGGGGAGGAEGTNHPRQERNGRRKGRGGDRGGRGGAGAAGGRRGARGWGGRWGGGRPGTRAQPEEHHPGAPAQRAGRLHRAVGVGEELARLRHDLRRGPAPLRRVAVVVRPAVPRPDGEARRRLHRGALAGDLDRPEVHLAQPPVDGGDHHRDLRLPPGAVRPDRTPALPQVRPADRPPDARADRRPGHAAARGHPVPGAGAGGPGAQGRVREAPEGPRRPGVRPGADRRRGPRARRADPAPKNYKHTIEVVVDRLVAKPDIRRRVADSVESGPAADGGARRDRGADPRRRGRPDLQPGPGVHVRRALVRRAPAEELLVQLAVRRVPDLRRPRRPPRGRRGARRPRPRPVDRRGRARAVVERQGRVLGPGPGRRRGLARLLDEDPVEEAPEEGPRRRPVRLGRGDLRQVQEPVRADPFVLDHVRGRGAGGRTPARRDRLGEPARAARGVHARGPVPRVRRRPAAPGDPGRHRRRPQHLAAHEPVDPRDADVHARGPAERAGADDRRTPPEGDPRAPAVPRRRRARLPDPVAGVGDARRGGGAADPPGHPDRERAGRRALHPGRALDRPAPARQPAADRHAGPAARPGEHAHRGRARRGDDPGGRPHRRHRTARGGARRRDRLLRRPQGAARIRDLAHRDVPLGPPGDPDARGAPHAGGAMAEGARRARAQPEGHRRRDPARRPRVRHRRERQRASPRSSRRSCCAR